MMASKKKDIANLKLDIAHFLKYHLTHNSTERVRCKKIRVSINVSFTWDKQPSQNRMTLYIYIYMDTLFWVKDFHLHEIK